MLTPHSCEPLLGHLCHIACSALPAKASPCAPLQASVVKVLEYNFLNSSVALFGYYFAAFTVDKPWMGRRRMQLMGFGFIFVIFLIGGAAFTRLTATKTNLSWFQVS